MKFFKYILSVFFLLFTEGILLFSSCERLITTEIEADDTIPLAVECIITSEYKYQTVKLTQPFYQVDTTPTGISNAQVTIYNNRGKTDFYESPDSVGLYLSEEKFAANIDLLYSLYIILEKDTFIAQAEMIAATPIEDIPYETSSNNTSMYMLSNTFTSDEEAMWKIFIDWSYLEAYSDTVNQALTYLYSFNTIDINQVFAPEKELIEFPPGAKIHVTKYSLTEEHAEYYRAVLSEVEWSGGYFDISPSNTPSNFNNNAVGYFGACTVIEDSTIVE